MAIDANWLMENWLVARIIRHRVGIPLSDLGPFGANARHTLQRLRMEERIYAGPARCLSRQLRWGCLVAKPPSHIANTEEDSLRFLVPGGALSTRHIGFAM
jgi:hypothetical protein